MICIIALFAVVNINLVVLALAGNSAAMIANVIMVAYFITRQAINQRSGYYDKIDATGAFGLLTVFSGVFLTTQVLFMLVSG